MSLELQKKKMRKRISFLVKKFLTCTSSEPKKTTSPEGVDLREEYAKAFRTVSYLDFWTRVLSLATNQSTTQYTMDSTAAARLPSYRLFAEHLLDPDQPAVSRILESAHYEPIYHSLLYDYFAQTANASLLCGILLKQINRTRVKHKHLRNMFENPKLSPKRSFHLLIAQSTDLIGPPNPLPSVLAVQEGCIELMKQLESSRDKVRTKVNRANQAVRSSVVFIVALVASLAVIVLSHGIIVLVAAPGLAVTLFEPPSSKRQTRVAAQLDRAAKGTYTLNRDLDTIGRLVARLNHELEHMRIVVKFLVERKDGEIRAIEEVARQLKISYTSFSHQLDELEEHLYLCFMTINRARNLVLREISGRARPTKDPST